MDPNAGAQQMAQMLEKGEHPLQVERGIGPIEFIAHSQDNAPMSQGAWRVDEAIRNGWLVHDGDRQLRSHVLNAVRKATVRRSTV
jgi:phage terminase large subunit-like protein